MDTDSGVIVRAFAHLVKVGSAVYFWRGALLRPHRIEVAPRVGHLRVDLEGPLEMSRGLVQPTRERQHQAEIVLDGAVSGFDLHRALQVLERLGPPADRGQRHPHVPVRGGVAGIEGERMRELPDCLVQP
jgi:hypothetical protein